MFKKPYKLKNSKRINDKEIINFNPNPNNDFSCCINKKIFYMKAHLN